MRKIKGKRIFIHYVLLVLILSSSLVFAGEEPMYPENPVQPRPPQSPQLEEDGETIGEKLDLYFRGPYMDGYEDGSFRPEKELSRGELAVILYRLMKPDYILTIDDRSCGLQDIEGHWAEEEMETLINAGLVSGYIDQTFRPDSLVTRGEFASILDKLGELDKEEGVSFIDTGGHWARDSIARVAKKGWITGYKDQSFRPDNNLSRAEFITVVNKLLDRSPDQMTNKLLVSRFRDLDKDKWYYRQVILATNLN